MWPATSTQCLGPQRGSCSRLSRGQLCSAPVAAAFRSARGRRVRLIAKAEKKQTTTDTTSSGPTSETGVGLKAVWYGAEQFGKLINLGKSSPQQQTAASSGATKQLSREEIVASIREDYDKNYFVSGVGDMVAYADNCVFADPFVSFEGVKRFKQNVGNLGGLMSDIKLDVFDWEETSNSIKTQWRFSCILDLPWRPRLAASGGTTHILDLDKGLVVKHIEEWNIEPGKVVQQLLRPASRVPESRWEVFMNSVSDGDVKGVWYAINTPVVKIVAPVVAVSLVTKLVTGEGLPGTFLGTVEGISWLLFVSGLVTEVVKFAQGMQGGETGTGGRF